MATQTGGLPPTYDLTDSSGIRLGAVLARAGEGTIHAVEGRPDLAAKIFHPTLKRLDIKLAKVAAMIASLPQGASQHDGFTVLTWPTGLVREGGKPVGYVMPRIDAANAVEIHAISNPASRSHPLAGKPSWPMQAKWSHLVTVAANLCVAVDVVHRLDAVIGDFQERNILVADTSRVCLVDCDSMQFTDHAGVVHLCAVGRPEFSAPELLNRDLALHVRHSESDLFVLAIHIYLLLMSGNHPFLRGSWTGDGEQPGPAELAKTGDWAGGPDSRLRAHPLAPPVTFLPAAVQQLFTRAFSLGATDPSARPTAKEWHAALTAMTVTDCSVGTHKVPSGAAHCPWCSIEAERARRRREASAQLRSPHTVETTTPEQVSTIVHAPTQTTAAPAVKRPTTNRPPFRSTTTTRPSKSRTQTPDVLGDEFGRGLYRLFLVFGIPFAIFIVILVGWIFVYIVQSL